MINVETQNFASPLGLVCITRRRYNILRLLYDIQEMHIGDLHIGDSPKVRGASTRGILWFT